MKRFSVAMCLSLCVALPASAQIYKWVDANGEVKYSDKPPPSNVKTEKLRASPPAASAPAASGAKAGPKTAAEQEQAFRKRQLEATKAQEAEEQKQAKARERGEDCKRAKAALANLEMGGRFARVDDKGERVVLGDQEIAQLTAKARQEVAAACN